MQLVTPEDEVDWVAVRSDYEAGIMTRNEIAHRHRIRRALLDERIRSQRWGLGRSEVEERKTIIELLFWAIERHARHLGEVDLAGSSDKEVAVLQKLATSLDRLISLDAKASGKAPDARQSRELGELRGRIAKRLGELRVQ